jgi:hypothetical protein
MELHTAPEKNHDNSPGSSKDFESLWGDSTLCSPFVRAKVSLFVGAKYIAMKFVKEPDFRRFRR